MSDTIDIEKLQTDLRDKLKSETYFIDSVNVVSLRKLLVASQTEQALASITKMGDHAGVGVIVGMPTVGVDDPNVPGPKMDITVPLRTLENPVINQGPMGTGKSAEAVTIQVLEHLHQFGIEGKCSLYADKKAMLPVTDIPGHVGYDAFLRGSFPINPLAEWTQPTISAVGLTVTLGAVPGAFVYYTVDDTFPGPGNRDANGNLLATVYTVPFVVLSGTVVRWAAFKPGTSGTRGSTIGRATIT